jgi:hypothetical protein
MAYTNYEEIQKDFKDIEFLETGTNINQDAVTQYILESDALINSYIGSRYQTPVLKTAGEGYQLLKFLSRSLVAARIKKILEVKQEKNVDANQSVVGVLFSPSRVISVLEDIKNDIIALAGATPLESRNGFFSSNATNAVEFVAKKDEKQW